ncbi:MAG: molybdopterin oxidoreductase family protein [Chloroflexota bacterium]
MLRQQIRGVCPHDCPDTCGIVTEVENGKAVKFYADRHHPVTQGWLCVKVSPYLDHVYHPDRLQHPLKRVGPKGSGQWAQISWEEALQEISAQWQQIIAEYGAEAILPYSYSGTLGLLQMTVSSARFWNRMGASRLERSICCMAAITAVEATLGLRWSPAYETMPDSKLIVLWGHNPVSTAPHLMPHLTRAQRQGTEIIVIDPRCTKTAKRADWHIAPLPGTDGALALGLGHIIVQEGWHDETWLNAHTVGWPHLRERLQAYDPDTVSSLTGLSSDTIFELAKRYATTKRSILKVADGVQRNFNGGQAVRAICALPALTGQYGQQGGGLAYSTSGLYDWDAQSVTHSQDCVKVSRKVNMNRLGAALTGEITDPPIKSLYVFGANPVASSPNARLIVEGLKRDDLFTVVHELLMTDTADYADIVLPATSQLEQVDVHQAYGHTNLRYNHPAIAPLGECKSNWDVFRVLSESMGYDEPWLHQSADEVLDEIITASAQKSVRLAGLKLDRLKSEGQVPLNLPGTVPFADLKFPTPSGKVELYSEVMQNLGHDPLPTYQHKQDPILAQATNQDDALNLVSGGAHHFVSSSMANQDGLLKREGKPFLEIHPQDAIPRNIQDGMTVRVHNARGWCLLQAVVTDTVRPGVVASPKGFWPKNDPWKNGDGGRNINWLTSDELADVAGQSTYHNTQVWIQPIQAAD